MSSIGDLFQACDLDGSGSIDRDELAAICPDLTADEIDSIFAELDKDGDGTISISEFSKGFQGLSSTLTGLSRAPEADPSDNNNETRATSNEEKWETDECDGDISRRLANELRDIGAPVNEDLITSLSCQEQVCELYQNLHATNSPELLAQFENVILAVIKDIRQHQHDSEQLESTLKKEKEKHMKQLQELEEELENQVSKLESKIRREEQEKLEQEKLELKRQLEAEISELKANMAKLHQLEALQREEKPSDEMKARLDEISEENRFLQSKLTDAQTKLALLRCELATTKQVMEEKCYELQHEKHTLMEYLKEQENLTRQVHVLHDANKRLHDTNDDLREALENSRHFSLKPSIENASTPLNKGDYVKQYLSSPARSPVCGASLADELSMIEGPKRKMLPTQDSCEVDSLPEDFDSGHSTMRDGHDPDSEYEAMTPEDDYYNQRKRSRLLRLNSGFDSAAESENSPKEGAAMLKPIAERDEVPENGDSNTGHKHKHGKDYERNVKTGRSEMDDNKIVHNRDENDRNTRSLMEELGDCDNGLAAADRQASSASSTDSLSDVQERVATDSAVKKRFGSSRRRMLANVGGGIENTANHGAPSRLAKRAQDRERELIEEDNGSSGDVLPNDASENGTEGHDVADGESRASSAPTSQGQCTGAASTRNDEGECCPADGHLSGRLQSDSGAVASAKQVPSDVIRIAEEVDVDSEQLSRQGVDNQAGITKQPTNVQGRDTCTMESKPSETSLRESDMEAEAQTHAVSDGFGSEQTNMPTEDLTRTGRQGGTGQPTGSDLCVQDSGRPTPGVPGQEDATGADVTSGDVVDGEFLQNRIPNVNGASNQDGVTPGNDITGRSVTMSGMGVAEGNCVPGTKQSGHPDFTQEIVDKENTAVHQAGASLTGRGIIPARLGASDLGSLPTEPNPASESAGGRHHQGTISTSQTQPRSIVQGPIGVPPAISGSPLASAAVSVSGSRDPAREGPVNGASTVSRDELDHGIICPDRDSPVTRQADDRTPNGSLQLANCGEHCTMSREGAALANPGCENDAGSRPRDDSSDLQAAIQNEALLRSVSSPQINKTFEQQSAFQNPAPVPPPTSVPVQRCNSAEDSVMKQGSCESSVSDVQDVQPLTSRVPSEGLTGSTNSRVGEGVALQQTNARAETNTPVCRGVTREFARSSENNVIGQARVPRGAAERNPAALNYDMSVEGRIQPATDLPSHVVVNGTALQAATLPGNEDPTSAGFGPSGYVNLPETVQPLHQHNSPVYANVQPGMCNTSPDDWPRQSNTSCQPSVICTATSQMKEITPDASAAGNLIRSNAPATGNLPEQSGSGMTRILQTDGHACAGSFPAAGVPDRYAESGQGNAGQFAGDVNYKFNTATEAGERLENTSSDGRKEFTQNDTSQQMNRTEPRTSEPIARNSQQDFSATLIGSIPSGLTHANRNSVTDSMASAERDTNAAHSVDLHAGTHNNAVPYNGVLRHADVSTTYALPSIATGGVYSQDSLCTKPYIGGQDKIIAQPYGSGELNSTCTGNMRQETPVLAAHPPGTESSRQNGNASFTSTASRAQIPTRSHESGQTVTLPGGALQTGGDTKQHHTISNLTGVPYQEIDSTTTEYQSEYQTKPPERNIEPFHNNKSEGNMPKHVQNLPENRMAIQCTNPVNSATVETVGWPQVSNAFNTLQENNVSDQVNNIPTGRTSGKCDQYASPTQSIINARQSSIPVSQHNIISEQRVVYPGQNNIPAGQGIGPDIIPVGQSNNVPRQRAIQGGQNSTPTRQSGILSGHCNIPVRESNIPTRQNDIYAGQGNIPTERNTIPLAMSNISAGQQGIHPGQSSIQVDQSGIQLGQGNTMSGQSHFPVGQIISGEITVSPRNTHTPGSLPVLGSNKDAQFAGTMMPNRPQPERNPQGHGRVPSAAVSTTMWPNTGNLDTQNNLYKPWLAPLAEPSAGLPVTSGQRAFRTGAVGEIGVTMKGWGMTGHNISSSQNVLQPIDNVEAPQSRTSEENAYSLPRATADGGNRNAVTLNENQRPIEHQGGVPGQWDVRDPEQGRAASLVAVNDQREFGVQREAIEREIYANHQTPAADKRDSTPSSGTVTTIRSGMLTQQYADRPHAPVVGIFQSAGLNPEADPGFADQQVNSGNTRPLSPLITEPGHMMHGREAELGQANPIRPVAERTEYAPEGRRYVNYYGGSNFDDRARWSSEDNNRALNAQQQYLSDSQSKKLPRRSPGDSGPSQNEAGVRQSPRRASRGSESSFGGESLGAAFQPIRKPRESDLTDNGVARERETGNENSANAIVNRPRATSTGSERRFDRSGGDVADEAVLTRKGLCPDQTGKTGPHSGSRFSEHDYLSARGSTGSADHSWYKHRDEVKVTDEESRSDGPSNTRSGAHPDPASRTDANWDEFVDSVFDDGFSANLSRSHTAFWRRRSSRRSTNPDSTSGDKLRPVRERVSCDVKSYTDKWLVASVQGRGEPFGIRWCMDTAPCRW